MKFYPFILLIAFLSITPAGRAQIHHDPKAKTVQIKSKDQHILLNIDYARGVMINSIAVDKANVLGSAGAITAVKTAQSSHRSTESAALSVKVNKGKNQIILNEINMGDVTESWTFSLKGNSIIWTINRNYLKDMMLEDMAMPAWYFQNLKTWKGGILDNGGMVWCKYLSEPGDTYGVHTGGVTFWNEDREAALKITTRGQDQQKTASKYSHQADGTFSFTTLISPQELEQRYNLSRFVHGKQDVFAPFAVKKGKVTLALELSYENYLDTYSRGNLPGIDTAAVRELLNTTGRYGVVDNNIVGANGWLTNWKCLHEPFFAQIGLALNDKNYTSNLAASLDQERDLAVLADGRVLSRWHDVPGDEIPGTYNKQTGYYEAMWGYTVDSQTGYLINTAEQFHQTGDLDWLKGHKETCERALDWLIRRDSNGNGLFEMVNSNVSEQKASDWIDIVWAGFENAFVNAQMYEALHLWSDCEKILGDNDKAAYYQNIADKLKESFNKPVDEGGFWYPQKKQYIYWRDKDGTIRGDNLVTPVNFAAIAFGICDNQKRIDTILSNIEERTAAENLFHWPLVFDSFKKEEVHANNWPFPRYENGDIFPTWGYLGIRSYVKYNKNLALKYIRNILTQYRKDGLSSQRYSRTDQKGQGTDILSGISTTVTALYSDIYGIQPKWNRMGLVPNLIPELNGTEFNYTLRGTRYNIKLRMNEYHLSTADFHVQSSQAFGVAQSGLNLSYYPENKEDIILVQFGNKPAFNDLQVTLWKNDHYQWVSTGKHIKKFEIRGLAPAASYELQVGGKKSVLTVSSSGILSITAAQEGSGQYTLHAR